MIQRLGSSFVRFKSALAGTISRLLTDKLNELINVRDFGAKGDGVTDDYAAIMAAYAWASTSSKKLYFPYGTYISSQNIVFSKPEVMVVGDGIRATSLRITAAGVAVEFNDSNPNHGQYAFTGGIKDMELVGNPQTTIILYNNSVNHWKCDTVNLREADTNVGIGLKMVDTTASHIQHVVCSTNAQAMTSRPAHGLWFDAGPVTGGRTACTTLLHPIIEGMTSDGVHLRGCDQLMWLGGTSENNDGNGVTFAAQGQPRINTLIGVGFEHNRGFADIYDAGQMNRFINCTSLTRTYFAPTSLYADMVGGYHQTITIEGEFTTVHDLKYSFFESVHGTRGTFTKAENSTVYNVFNGSDNAVTTFPNAIKPVTVTGSPFIWTNYTGKSVSFIVSPETPANIIAIWLHTSSTSGRVAKLDHGGMISLEPGNAIELVYTGVVSASYIVK